MPTPRLTSSTAATIPLPDADGSTDGLQVDLAVGPNTIKVEVTAEDGITVNTYILTVTRTAEDTSLSPPASDPAAAFPSTAVYTVTFKGDWTTSRHAGRRPFGCTLLEADRRDPQRRRDLPGERRDGQRRGRVHGGSRGMDRPAG